LISNKEIPNFYSFYNGILDKEIQGFDTFCEDVGGFDTGVSVHPALLYLFLAIGATAVWSY